MGGAELAVTGVTVDVMNGLTTPDQEMIVGSYSPDDFASISKTITIRSTYKLPDAQLYRKIVTGSATGIKWVDDVSEGQAVIQVQSPADIVGTTPFEMKWTLPSVIWQVTNPRLAGTNIVAIDLIGTAVTKAATNFAQLDLFNNRSSAYAWPT